MMYLQNFSRGQRLFQHPVVHLQKCRREPFHQSQFIVIDVVPLVLGEVARLLQLDFLHSLHRRSFLLQLGALQRHRGHVQQPVMKCSRFEFGARIAGIGGVFEEIQRAV
jgi:hypothetical protein